MGDNHIPIEAKKHIAFHLQQIERIFGGDMSVSLFIREIGGPAFLFVSECDQIEVGEDIIECAKRENFQKEKLDQDDREDMH